MDERRMREGENLFLHDMIESEGDVVRCPLTQDYFSSNFDTYSRLEKNLGMISVNNSVFIMSSQIILQHLITYILFLWLT